MNAWLATEENRWFDPSTSVTLQKISFQRHLEVTMGISHNGFVYIVLQWWLQPNLVL